MLPGPVLIADRSNNRLLVVDPQGRILWQFPGPHELRRGTTFLVPDDAFFTRGGQNVLATQEDDFVISLISVGQHRILWRYGTPGVPGSGPNHVWNPDDAMPLPTGGVFSADIKNCRLIAVAPGAHVVRRQLGITGYCTHAPPRAFGSPNGAFPMRDGGWLITEINGDWVDALTPAGRVAFAVHPPAVSYPSDANEVAPGRYLVADFSSPGQLLIFGRGGRVLWRYAPASGPGELNHPSLALPLPNGDLLCNDDRNDRVIVIDRRTHRIVWQYGHTGVPGNTPGYLSNPDGVDLAPPFNLLAQVPATLRAPR